ncbi:MAG: hypothetical protein ACKPFA_31430, partial [Dolichospermum sp.]
MTRVQYAVGETIVSGWPGWVAVFDWEFSIVGEILYIDELSLAATKPLPIRLKLVSRQRLRLGSLEAKPLLIP